MQAMDSVQRIAAWLRSEDGSIPEDMATGRQLAAWAILPTLTKKFDQAIDGLFAQGLLVRADGRVQQREDVFQEAFRVDKTLSIREERRQQKKQGLADVSTRGEPWKKRGDAVEHALSTDFHGDTNTSTSTITKEDKRGNLPTAAAVEGDACASPQGSLFGTKEEKPAKQPRSPRFVAATYDPLGAERMPAGYADWAWAHLLEPAWETLRANNAGSRLGPCGKSSPAAKSELSSLLKAHGTAGVNILAHALGRNDWLMGRRGEFHGQPLGAGWVFATVDQRTGKPRWAAMLAESGASTVAGAIGAPPFIVAGQDFSELDAERRRIVEKNRQAMGAIQIVEFAKDLLEDQRGCFDE